MGCIWFGVCWRSVAVWLWRCGVFMQSEALLLFTQTFINLLLAVLNTLQNSKLARTPEDRVIVSKHIALCTVHMNLIGFCGSGIYATEFTTNATNLKIGIYCVINFLLSSKTEEFLRVTVFFFFLMASNLSVISAVLF